MGAGAVWGIGAGGAALGGALGAGRGGGDAVLNPLEGDDTITLPSLVITCINNSSIYTIK